MNNPLTPVAGPPPVIVCAFEFVTVPVNAAVSFKLSSSNCTVTVIPALLLFETSN